MPLVKRAKKAPSAESSESAAATSKPVSIFDDRRKNAGNVDPIIERRHRNFESNREWYLRVGFVADEIITLEDE